MNSKEIAWKAFYTEKHGCAWFLPPPDGKLRDPRNSIGYYSIGGNKAIPFNHYQEIPEGVFWTNLTKPECWSLGKIGKFKEGDFFGFNHLSLVSEMGYKSDEESVKKAVQDFSELFVRIACWLSDWSHKEFSKPWNWGEGTLMDALAFYWKDKDFIKSKNFSYPEEIFSRAYVAERKIEINPQQLIGTRQLRISLHRWEFLSKLFRTRVPKGKWVYLDETDWPKEQNSRKKYIIEKRKPMLILVDDPVWKLGSEGDGNLWLAQRGRTFAGSTLEPFWITGEEFQEVSEMADLIVLEGYECEGWGNIDEPDNFIFDWKEPYQPLSRMASLIGWSGWNALISPVRDPLRRTKLKVTPEMLWQRTAELRYLYQIARNIQNKGWTVIFYGQGSLQLVIHDGASPKKLVSDLLDLGVSIPPSLHSLIDKEYYFSDINALKTKDWIYSLSNPEIWSDIDRIFAFWPGPVKDVKMLMAKSATKLEKIDTSFNVDFSKKWKEMLHSQAKISVEKLNNRIVK